METFSALLALCAGNSLVTGEFPAQRPVTQSLDGFIDLRPNKRLSEAGDLRRHRAYCDVTVMKIQYIARVIWCIQAKRECYANCPLFVVFCYNFDMGPYLLTWINFNTDLDKWLHLL